MLSCREITELATEYAEGSMGLYDRVRFLMHLSMCGHCRRYVRQLKETVRTVGRLEAPPPSPETKAALLEQFKDWKR